MAMPMQSAPSEACTPTEVWQLRPQPSAFNCARACVVNMKSQAIIAARVVTFVLPIFLMTPRPAGRWARIAMTMFITRQDSKSRRWRERGWMGTGDRPAGAGFWRGGPESGARWDVRRPHAHPQRSPSLPRLFLPWPHCSDHAAIDKTKNGPFHHAFNFLDYGGRKHGGRDQGGGARWDVRRRPHARSQRSPSPAPPIPAPATPHHAETVFSGGGRGAGRTGRCALGRPAAVCPFPAIWSLHASKNPTGFLG